MDIKKRSVWIVSFVSAVIGSLVTTVSFALSPAILPDFPDVDDNAYYADSVYRMRSMGVINGYENGNFGPNDAVTRGQFATMLDRYDNNIIPEEPMPRNDVWYLAYLICEEHRAEGIDETNETLNMAYDRICKNKVFYDPMDF